MVYAVNFSLYVAYEGTLPSEFGKLRKLEELYIAVNCLEGIDLLVLFLFSIYLVITVNNIYTYRCRY